MSSIARAGSPRRPSWLAYLAVLAIAGCAQTEPGDDAEPSSRPVVVLSPDIGEVLAASALAEQVSYGPEVPDGARLAYANVDTLEIPGGAEELAALEAARARHIPILLESNEWDVARLHAALGALFPSSRVDELENVAVLATWDDASASWRLSDTTPAEVADYLGNQAQVAAPEVYATGSKQAHWLLPFAEAAYNAPQTVTASGGPTQFRGDYGLAWSKDVVKLYKRTNSGVVNCVIAWRGTTSIFTASGFIEWIEDVSSQVVKRPFYMGDGAGERVGRFWNLRLSNQRHVVNDATDYHGCENVHITGHSLGGAMAQIYAHYYVFGGNDSSHLPASLVRTVVAWNPARVGNETFKDSYRDRVLADDRVSWVYCRNGDPVRGVPTSLKHTGGGTYGCDINGVKRAYIELWKNHSMDYWYQCESSTSC